MKTLFVRNFKYLCDENSNGKPDYPRLPATIYLAAAYCSSKGHNVDIISIVEDSDYKPEQYDTVVVWVPLFEGFNLHIEYLRKAKELGKKTIMVLNDALESLEEEILTTYDFIDIAIRPSEREIVLDKLLNFLSQDINVTKFDLKGIMYKDENNNIIDNGKSPILGSLEHLSSSSEFLKKENFYLYDQAFIEVGRGCPYPCEFCVINKTQHRVRKIEDIIDELKVIEGKVNFVWLHDNNMLYNKEFTKELCNTIIKENIKFTWATEGRIELCDDIELLKLMNKAGCKKIATGLESGDQEVLKHIKKSTNLKSLEMATKNCEDNGIDLIVNIMIGYPREDKDALSRTLMVAKKYNISYVQFIRPLRGTPLYKKYKELGIFKGELTLKDYVDCRDEPMFPTLYLSKNQLIFKRRLFALSSFKSLKQILMNKLINFKRMIAG